MKTNNRYFKLKSREVFITSLLGQIIFASTYIVIARNEDFTDFAILSAIGTFSQLIYLMLDFGENAYCVREISAKRLPISLFRIRMKIKLQICIILSLIVLSIFTIFKPNLSILVALTLTWSLLNLIEYSLFIPYRASIFMNLPSRLVLLEKSLALLLVYLNYKFSGKIEITYISLLASSMITIFFTIIMLRKFVTRNVPEEELKNEVQQVKVPWKGVSGYGLIGVISNAQSLEIILTKILAGIESVAYLTSIRKWVNPITLIMYSSGDALVPSLSQVKSKNEAFEIMKALRGNYYLSILGCLALFIGSNTIIVHTLGLRYIQSTLILKWLCIGTLLQVTSYPFILTLRALQREKDVVVCMIWSLLFNVFVICILIPEFGTIGVSIAFTLAQSLQLILLLKYTKEIS